MMTFNELFPLKVLINLDKREDRLKICMEEEFPKIKCEPIRKPGNIFPQIENPWWRGAVGCMVSHYEILQAALLLKQNVAIFEDDIQFLSPECFRLLDLCSQELEDMDEWDLFYGSGNILKPFYKVTDHLARLSHCQSTVFYCVNKNFIEKLLSYIDLKNISAPIDVILAEKVIPENRCFISWPMAAIQRDSFSDIEGKDVKYSDYLQKRYWDNLRVEDKNDKIIN